MQLTEQQIGSLRTFFQHKLVQKAWVFGSFARGEATEESDIDLLLEIDYYPGFSSDYFQMMYDVQVLMNRKVDLVAVGELSPFIKKYVERDKKLIYERQAA